MSEPEYWFIGADLAESLCGTIKSLRQDPKLRDLLPLRFQQIPTNQLYFGAAHLITSGERWLLTKLVEVCTQRCHACGKAS